MKMVGGFVWEILDRQGHGRAQTREKVQSRRASNQLRTRWAEKKITNSNQEVGILEHITAD